MRWLYRGVGCASPPAELAHPGAEPALPTALVVLPSAPEGEHTLLAAKPPAKSENPRLLAEKPTDPTKSPPDLCAEPTAAAVKPTALVDLPPAPEGEHTLLAGKPPDPTKNPPAPDRGGELFGQDREMRLPTLTSVLTGDMGDKEGRLSCSYSYPSFLSLPSTAPCPCRGQSSLMLLKPILTLSRPNPHIFARMVSFCLSAEWLPWNLRSETSPLRVRGNII
jgi:hypothetical protein